MSETAFDRVSRAILVAWKAAAGSEGPPVVQWAEIAARAALSAPVTEPRGCPTPGASEAVERAFDIGRMWQHSLTGHVLDARDVCRTLGSSLFEGIPIPKWSIDMHMSRDDAITQAVADIKTGLRAALTAPPSPGAMPVAWEYRYRHGSPDAAWSKWGPHDPAYDGHKNWLKESRPLFAHPVPSLEGDIGELVQRLNSTAKMRFTTGNMQIDDLCTEAASRLSTQAAELAELHRAILGGEPDPTLTHGQFLEMIRMTDDARAAALGRALRAESSLASAKAALSAISSDLRIPDWIREIAAGALLEEPK